MIRILFVCHGNICRSPMGESVMKDLVTRQGLADKFVIDSAATSTEELGNPVHPGTRRVLEHHGIPCVEHYARQIKPDEARDWDYIIAMDKNNLRNLGRILPQGNAHKLFKLREFSGTKSDIADPWYTHDFDTTFEQVHDGCVGLLRYLETIGTL